MHRHLGPTLDLHQHVERRRRAALQNGLLGAPPARLDVAQRYRLDAAHQVGQRRIHHQVIQRIAVRCRHQLHAALGDRARGVGVQLYAYLVYDDHLRHMVLHRLDHHVVLERGRRHLHPARASDGGMRDIAVAGDLVRRIHNYHPPVCVVRKHAGYLAQHRRLAHAGLAEQQHALAGHYQVFYDANGAVHGATHAQRKPDDDARAVAYRRDTVQRAFYACAVVLAELADSLYRVRDVLSRHLRLAERNALVAEARFWNAPQVQHHL